MCVHTLLTRMYICVDVYLYICFIGIYVYIDVYICIDAYMIPAYQSNPWESDFRLKDFKSKKWYVLLEAM